MFTFLRVMVPVSLWVMAAPGFAAPPIAIAQPAPVTVISQAGITGMTINVATLAAGRLVITGTAASAGQVISIKTTNFRATANSQKRFSFNVDFRTPNCRVHLVTNTGWVGLAIGNCGPVGVVNRGFWSPANAYVRNDIVSFGGAAWIARRANSKMQPGLPATATDWQLLVMRGARGAQGVPGAAGPAGSEGPLGPIGPQGPQGPTGLAGAAGPLGPQGPAGPAGLVSRGEWDDTVRYDANDLVLYQGSTWRALMPNELAPPELNASEWQLFAQRGLPGEAGGPPGPTGPQGAVGPVGPAGPQGLSGADGTDGAESAEGPAGPQGPQGNPGPSGAQGPAGPAGPVGESANIVKRSKTCTSAPDYSFDQSNNPYCVVTCDVDEIGLFTWWEWIDLSNGKLVAGYSSTVQMYTPSVPELANRYGFAAYVGLNEFMSTRKMNLFLFCTPR